MRCSGGKFLLRAVLPILVVSTSMCLHGQGTSAPAGGAAAGGSAPAGNTGGVGSAGTTGTRGTTGNNGSIFNNNRNNNPGQQMPTPIFLSGRVMMDDGSPADRDVRIERVCGGMSHIEGHADSKGRFSFQLGQNSALDMDASDSSMSYGRPGSLGSMNTGAGGFGNTGGFGDRTGTNLWNCELRASFPGYRSDVVQLGGRRALDSPDVGTIVLHRLGNVQGTTISLTTALAPKDARKEYEKGLQLTQKGKFEEAMARLSKATELYPKYAVAWYALGELQQKGGHGNDARTAYEKAISADTKYVSPLNQMALLAAQEGKWEEAANFSKQAISLNPVEFPSAFWYNALANYNLKRSSAAVQSTKDLLKLDTRHHFPDAENLMAQLLLESGNYPEAASHLRNYLALAPNAKNADALKQMLLKIEAASAAPPAPVAATGKP